MTSTSLDAEEPRRRAMHRLATGLSHDDSCREDTGPPFIRTRATTEPLLHSRPRLFSISKTHAALADEDAHRRLPSIRFEIEETGKESAMSLRSVSIVINRRSHASRVATTIISINVFLLRLLTIFSLLSTATGLTLTAGLSRRASPRSATIRMDLEDSFGGWGLNSASRGADVWAPSSSAFGSVPASRGASEARGSRQSWNDGQIGWRPAAHSTEERRAALEAASQIEVPPPPERIFSRRELQARLAQHGGLPTVVVFGARRCRMCRMLQPKLERLAADGGARFFFLYHDRTTDDVFSEQGVTQTPTTVVYDGVGTEVSREVYTSSGLREFEALLSSLHGGRAAEWSPSSRADACADTCVRALL